MSKADILVKFYKGLLETLDVIADENGLLSHRNETPVMIDENHRLALPTPTILENLMDGGVAVFHPLSESLFAKLSPVMIEFRYMVMSKINQIIICNAYTLLKLAADPSMHSRLTDKQIETISKLTEGLTGKAKVDEKLVNSFKTLSNRIEIEGQLRCVNIILKHGDTIGETKYPRVARMYFPLIEAIHETEDNKVYDVQFRKNDITILKNLFEIIVPGALTPDRYSMGSDSRVAPYFVACLRAYVSFMAETAGLTWRFRTYIQDNVDQDIHVSASHLTDLLEQAGSFKDLVNAIRPMPFNIGDETEGGTPQPNATSASGYSQPAPSVQEQVASAVNRAIAPQPPQAHPAMARPPQVPVQPTYGNQGGLLGTGRLPRRNTRPAAPPPPQPMGYGYAPPPGQPYPQIPPAPQPYGYNQGYQQPQPYGQPVGGYGQAQPAPGPSVTSSAPRQHRRV